ncbi:MAG: tRNA lysidine(34) synthetase TilS [Ewingella americana]|jgi:tRNA(Ile)-lysidine synthase|uniref:tRNA lysidine(34) synthetase TilS n=1 Tax=Ewingella americana TaxID=41202 RepID=UPI00242BCE9E|nr:tRNA lysidine(34) synthetase TilS [Ewingella americana]MCI1679271.1 tRNA lysidine(34) synthetase TilS [Ewingella americana]MCI1854598.1 tRNA lysidine(34) synthetase TilS [Ewingella americana]MCI1862119.1 tRNA lysidine(34) synthetase TilS [Ewingella americana]MCI2142500.1 tRNA lysidine(34) synthetase TilS [Ewingella americana]MCI2162326.1 tRNA lysidine(34) synthetase TilS [Ewingella americana]
MNSPAPNPVLAELIKHIGSERKLCVAFSGGLDSSVLLSALVKLRDSQWPELSLRAIHVHHGLSQFADSWVSHCQAFCQKLGVPLEVIRVKVDSQQDGIEAAARKARYQAFANSLAGDECLLTAQHLNDQCETFMLALKRGSGPAGLSSMAVDGVRQHYRLLRPLLSLSRDQLEEFASAAQLSWIEDDSNRDARFDRNFLRLNVLPALYQRWPHFPDAVARSAALCAEQESLLDELLAESLQALQSSDGGLQIEPMQAMSSPRRQALLRRWLAQLGAKMPSREQLQRIWDEVAMCRDDAEPQFRLNTLSIRRFRQRLYLLPAKLPSLREVVVPWDIANELVLPEGLGRLTVERLADSSQQGLRLPASDEVVTIRFTAQGRVEKVGRQHGRSLKKLWPELGVAPWERERTPLVFYNEQLVAAPGLFITQQGVAEQGQPHYQMVWHRGVADG